MKFDESGGAVRLKIVSASQVLFGPPNRQNEFFESKRFCHCWARIISISPDPQRRLFSTIFLQRDAARLRQVYSGTGAQDNEDLGKHIAKH